MFFNFATFTCRLWGADLVNGDFAYPCEWNDSCLPIGQRPENQMEICRASVASRTCARAENQRYRKHSWLRIEACHSVTQGEGQSAAPQRRKELSRKTGREIAFIYSFVTVLLISVTTVLTGCAGLPQSKQSGSAATSSTLSSASSQTATAHSVQLTWAPSQSNAVLGYNVYRAVQSGGPYTRLNPALLANPDYLDTTIAGGNTYYYSVTAASAITESHRSPEVVAVIPAK
jgi:hypothetical protein